MSRILLLLAFCCVCFLAVEAQDSGRLLCERQNRICLNNERRLGRRDDVTDVFNQRCRRINNRWRNISRCELVRASCHLTAIRCSTLSCRDVADVLRGGGGRPPTPSTTPRTPRPSTPPPDTTVATPAPAE